jgi:hypothetical protein
VNWGEEVAPSTPLSPACPSAKTTSAASRPARSKSHDWPAGAEAAQSVDDSMHSAGSQAGAAGATAAAATGTDSSYHSNGSGHDESSSGNDEDDDELHHKLHPRGAVAGVKEEPQEDGGGNLKKLCDGPPTSDAQKKKCINHLKHMSPDELKRHWREFLSLVSEELMSLQQQEEAAAAAAAEGPAPAPCASRASGTSGAAAPAAASDGGAAPAAEMGEAEEGAARADGPQGACGCPMQLPAGTPVGGALERIYGLVGKYLYVIKYVALLNPGEPRSSSHRIEIRCWELST